MIRTAIAAALLLASSRAPADEPAAAATRASPPAAKSAAKGSVPPAKGRASPGKPRAPVRVDARLVQGSAHLELTFESAARNVTVKLHGTNGLTVQEPQPALPKTDFAAGEKLPLDVTFTAPQGESHVVVSIDGDFNGIRQGTVQSLRVGKLSAEQQQKQQRGVVSDGKGGKIRLGPAQER